MEPVSLTPVLQAMAEEMLLALYTRVLGLTRVYVGHRLIKDRPRVEEARVQHNREKVDRNIHVLLPMDQWRQLTQAIRNQRSIIITGGPGSGKTELLKAACKESNLGVLIISAFKRDVTGPISCDSIHVPNLNMHFSETAIYLSCVKAFD